MGRGSAQVSPVGNRQVCTAQGLASLARSPAVQKWSRLGPGAGAAASPLQGKVTHREL